MNDEQERFRDRRNAGR
jgi:putative phosphoribosyl transferase